MGTTPTGPKIEHKGGLAAVPPESFKTELFLIHVPR